MEVWALKIYDIVGYYNTEDVEAYELFGFRPTAKDVFIELEKIDKKLNSDYFENNEIAKENILNIDKGDNEVGAAGYNVDIFKKRIRWING